MEKWKNTPNFEHERHWKKVFGMLFLKSINNIIEKKTIIHVE